MRRRRRSRAPGLRRLPVPDWEVYVNGTALPVDVRGGVARWRLSCSVGWPHPAHAWSDDPNDRLCAFWCPGKPQSFDALLHRAETEPIGVDLSDYSDEFCEGFLAGQRSVLEEIAAGRLELPEAKS